MNNYHEITFLQLLNWNKQALISIMDNFSKVSWIVKIWIKLKALLFHCLTFSFYLMKYFILTIFRLATILYNFHFTVRWCLDPQILNTLFYSVLIHVCLEYDGDYLPFRIFPLCAVYMVKSSYMWLGAVDGWPSGWITVLSIQGPSSFGNNRNLFPL